MLIELHIEIATPREITGETAEDMRMNASEMQDAVEKNLNSLFDHFSVLLKEKFGYEVYDVAVSAVNLDDDEEDAIKALDDAEIEQANAEYDDLVRTDSMRRGMDMMSGIQSWRNEQRMRCKEMGI